MVELDLADLAAQRGLRELLDRELEIGDAVSGALGVDDFVVENAVNVDHHVVLRDAVLLGNRDRALAQIERRAHRIDKRHENLQAAEDRAIEASQPLDDQGGLLPDHAHGREQDVNHQESEEAAHCDSDHCDISTGALFGFEPDGESFDSFDTAALTLVQINGFGVARGPG